MKRRRGTTTDLLSLVGWVFADLLLALTIVFIATQPGNPEAGAELAARGADASTTTTSTSTSTTTTTTTVPTAPPGVDSEFFCFVVRTDPAVLEGPEGPERDLQLLDLANQTRAELARVGASNRRAGIVLSFGASDEPGPGTSTANAFNALVLPLVPEVFTDGAGVPTASRGFWNGNPTAEKPRGAVVVNLYPITDAAHPPMPKGSGQSC